MVLVSEGMEEEASNYVHLLERCHTQVPGKLRDYAALHAEQQDHAGMGKLCSYMKALGECRRVVGSVDIEVI